MNPKVTMIISQCFPLVIERYEKDPSSPDVSIGSLERYRKMGYDAIRNLPQEEKEQNQRAIDAAFQESADRIQRLVDQRTRQPVEQDADDRSIQA